MRRHPGRSAAVPESTGTSGQDHHSGSAPHHGPGPLAAIAVGGALGTLARYGIERVAVPAPGGFPWSTWTVNVIGSFVLGAVVTLVVERWPGDRYLRPLVAVGFCGGFTTFSTLAVEVDQRIQHGHGTLAAVYLVATLVAGLAAALAGISLARGQVLPAAGAPLPDPDLLAGDEDEDEDSGGGGHRHRDGRTE
jgi:CrcB protein